MNADNLHDVLETGKFEVDSGKLNFSKIPDLNMLNILADYLGETQLYFPLNKTLGDINEIADSHRQWAGMIKRAKMRTNLFELSASDNMQIFYNIEELVIEFDLTNRSSKPSKINQLHDDTLSDFSREIINNYSNLKLLRIEAKKGKGQRTSKRSKNIDDLKDLKHIEEQLDTYFNPRKTGCEFTIGL